MTSDDPTSPGVTPHEAELREARRGLVRKMSEVILASADLLEVENQQASVDRLHLRSLLRGGQANPELIRGFLRTPVYEWVTHNFITGNTKGHLLCKMAELLYELAPEVFTAPKYER